MASLRLTAAFVANERSRPLLEGTIVPEGIALDAIALTPGDIFARQLKHAEFDVSDMSLASLLIATSRGPTPWLAFPVFTMRRFFHTGILVRRDSGIERPADLRGKRVGVPEYQQTANVWTRGVLEHEFGVHARELTWWMERTPDRSHGGATGFAPPPGVRLTYVPPETTLGEMLLAGDIDATLFYSPRNTATDRSSIDLAGHRAVRTLFADPAAEAARYHAATGLYPINHTMIVRRSIAEREPGMVARLEDAFARARAASERAAAPAFPMPYGLDEARPELETIARYLCEQELTPRPVPLEDVYGMR